MRLPPFFFTASSALASSAGASGPSSYSSPSLVMPTVARCSAILPISSRRPARTL
ncbi:hypothetical protein D3C72_2598450 [compost metagenome]